MAQKIIKIGTGDKKALAYPTLSNICKIYHKYSNKDIRCDVISTGCAVDNLQNIISGILDFGVTKTNKKAEISDYLRSMFGLHYEFFTF